MIGLWGEQKLFSMVQHCQVDSACSVDNKGGKKNEAFPEVYTVNSNVYTVNINV